MQARRRGRGARRAQAQARAEGADPRAEQAAEAAEDARGAARLAASSQAGAAARLAAAQRERAALAETLQAGPGRVTSARSCRRCWHVAQDFPWQNLHAPACQLMQL